MTSFTECRRASRRARLVEKSNGYHSKEARQARQAEKRAIAQHTAEFLKSLSSTTLGDGQPKAEGEWDWYGYFDPAIRPGTSYGPKTFSIGVFQWKLTQTGRPSKGKAVQRSHAPVQTPELAYEKAKRFITQQKKEPPNG